MPHPMTIERRAVVKTEVTRLRKDGTPVKSILKMLSIGYEAYNKALNPAYRTARREAVRHVRLDNARTLVCLSRRQIAADGAVRLMEIPPDTRSLTARLLGDPIPGDTRRVQLRAGRG